MIVEHAFFTIRAGSEADFEAAFEQARLVIASSKGFRNLALSRCIETPGQYLLLVEWDTLEDHTVGFRESDLFIEWRRLLSPYFESLPEVTHFTPLSRS
jgi:heme-degrading monooxygenase HmoA